MSDRQPDHETRPPAPGAGRMRQVESDTMQEQAFRELSLALMTGGFLPGQSVTLRGIASDLGTSLMPAREAVRRLVTLGALEMPNSRSTRVPPLDVQAFDQISEVRLMLEPDAAAAAAARATPPDVEALWRLVHEIEAHVEARDLGLFLGANRAFHRAIYALSANPYLIASIDGLWMRTGPYLGLLRGALETTAFRALVAGHRPIVDAIGSGSRADAARAMRALIQGARRFYADLTHGHLDRARGDTAGGPD